MNTDYRLGEWVIRPQHAQIERGSEVVHIKPKSMAVLECLLQAGGEVVTRDKLFETVWPGGVVSDATLTQCIVELRRAFGESAQDPQVIKTIPKIGFCLIPPIQRWVAEGTPLAVPESGHPVPEQATAAPESPERNEPLVGRQGSRKPALITVAALATAALLVTLVSLLFRDPDIVTPGLEHEPSIAVLPFANRSALEEDAFFVDGIHDELLSHIAKIGSIKTISGTSVRQYRGTTKTIPQIARELSVGTVLEGGVQRAGDQVRIHVQLIDAVTDELLWGEIYDRSLTAENLFVIQSEIATAIAGALKATLTLAEQDRINAIPTQNLDALEAYFIGRQSLERRTTIELAKAVDYFQEAVGLDPEFALAYVGLADTYLFQASYGNLPFAQSNELGQAAVDRAIELDDQLGEAYATLANLLRRANNFTAAEAAFKRALELRPNYASAYQWYGEFLSQEIGRPAEAVDFSRRAVELDPLSPIINSDLAEALDVAGRFDEAMVFYRRAIELDPGFAVAYSQAGTLHWLGLGRIDEAVAWYQQANALDPEGPYIPAIMGLAYLDLGEEALGARWIQRSFEQAPHRFLILSAMARLALYRGDEARALDFARRTVAENPGALYGLAILASSDLRGGRAGDARMRYETGFPSLTTTEPEINAENYEAAVDFALVLSRAGEHGRAEVLRKRVLEYIRTKPRMGYRGYWITDVKIHAQRGDTDKALAALRQAFEEGWRHYWWYYFDHDQSLEPLRGMAGFLDIRDEMEADLSDQLRRLEMSESGQSP